MYRRILIIIGIIARSTLGRRGSLAIPPFERCALRCMFSTFASWTFYPSHSSTERFSSIGFFATRFKFRWFCRYWWFKIRTLFSFCCGSTLCIQSTFTTMFVWVVTVKWFFCFSSNIFPLFFIRIIFVSVFSLLSYYQRNYYP